MSSKDRDHSLVCFTRMKLNTPKQ
uniref:Uncharacterized protein n=1 Tax=Tetranychus urticae TaxID=32264 RepID=T1KQ25_TETUR